MHVRQQSPIKRQSLIQDQKTSTETRRHQGSHWTAPPDLLILAFRCVVQARHRPWRTTRLVQQTRGSGTPKIQDQSHHTSQKARVFRVQECPEKTREPYDSVRNPQKTEEQANSPTSKIHPERVVRQPERVILLSSKLKHLPSTISRENNTTGLGQHDHKK
jgi:hypothetical protein